MALMLYFILIGIYEIEFHSAELSTLTTVCRTAETLLRSIAYTRIAYTERTMHKDLQLRRRIFLVDFPNFIKRKFTGKDHSIESKR